MTTAHELVGKLKYLDEYIFIKDHGLDIWDPEYGTYFIIDQNKGPDHPLKCYGQYGSAVKGAVRFIEKQYEPKVGDLSAADIDDYPWVVYQPGPDAYYVRNLKTGALSRDYPTYAKAERRLRTLVCRAIGRDRAKQAVA